MILHVQDVYPESLLAKLPAWLTPWLGASLRWLDRAAAQRADCVVLPAAGLRPEYIRSRRLLPSRVVALRNWQDETRFLGTIDHGAACARHGIDSTRFTFLYLGNVGATAGVDLLIRAFHRAQLPHAQLVVAGGGSAWRACEDLARQ
jgi:glycosyltransferase involved in cell wall biosynthesis